MPRPRTDVSIPLELALKRRSEVESCLKEARKKGYFNSVPPLLQQLRSADIQVSLAQRAEEEERLTEGKALTPAEAAAALVQLVMDAPLRVKWEIYRRIQEAHPNFEEQE